MLEPPPQAPDLFLRVPRGVAPTIAGEDGAYRLGGLTIYRYPGTDGKNLFLATSLLGAHDPKDPKQRELTPGEFRADFRLALGAILKKSFGPPERMERLKFPASPGAKEAGPDLEFDSFVLEEKADDGISVSVIFHQRGPRLLALGFQVPLGEKNDVAVQRGIELCLRSLDMGEGGVRKRSAYAALKRLD